MTKTNDLGYNGERSPKRGTIMADNIARIPIAVAWVNLNTASGIAIGTALKIQHVGGTRVDITISSSEPTSDIGEVMVPFEFYGVPAGETSAVWSKVHGKSGAATLSVQDDS